MSRAKSIAWLVALLAVAPVQAHAQTLLVPSFGGTFGGDTVDPPRVAYAVSIGYWGSEPFGVDVEVAHLPQFFLSRADLAQNVAGRLTTLAFNFVLGPSTRPGAVAGLRPYVSAGPVLYKFWPAGSGSVSCRDTATLGFGVGAGLLSSLSEHVGLRVDVRYFLNPQRGSSQTSCGQTTIDRFSGFDFSRASAGFAWRF